MHTLQTNLQETSNKLQDTHDYLTNEINYIIETTLITGVTREQTENLILKIVRSLRFRRQQAH